MSTINYEELFQQYYQREYDFNTASLSEEDIAVIKKLAHEKRVDYARAPMGTGVFDWILQQNSNLRFELVAFDSDKIDGMLYIPSIGQERAYIILNAKKPLINQIFTAAHEYYHYVMDYQKFEKTPYVCDFTMLKDINEKKACRFAAEILMPENALTNEIKIFCRAMKISSTKEMDFNCVATLLIYLTLKYQMPLKAVIYRLAEEDCIKDIDAYIRNYDFIKTVLKNIKIHEKRVEELYSLKNDYIEPYSLTYQDMEKAFDSGYATRENILEDAKKLDLDMNLIEEFVS